MTISVRPVDLQAESEDVLEILKTNLLAIPHPRRFQWLYRANPDGPARTWFAYERGKDHIVGVASVFPRAMWIGTQLKTCGQVGDFAVCASHRSLGPALLLQRATFEPVDQDKLGFCYDCPPHSTAMATFRRLGITANCTIERYALPLRLDRQFGKYLGFMAPPAARVANVALRIYGRMAAHRGEFEIVEQNGPFGEEFSRLDESVSSATSIRVQRGARQLNWRYRDDPLQKHRVLTARRKGELVAFLVFSEMGETVRIEDLFGLKIDHAGIALLEAVVERCGLAPHGIEAYLSSESPLVNTFKKARFYRRLVAAQVVAYTKQGSATAAFVSHHPTWAFTGADVQA